MGWNSYSDAEVEWQDRHVETHWWHVGRRRIVTRLLQAIGNGNRTGMNRPVLLEVGCGVGGLWRELAHLAWPIGLDRSAQAIRCAKRRGYSSLIEADVVNLPVRSESVDGLLALDVLEHVPEDRCVLKEYFRCVRPGGWMVLTVPAHPWIWSNLDERAGHLRRYRFWDLSDKIQSAGFSIQKISYFNSLLFPVVAAIRLAQRGLKRWISFDSSSMEPPRFPGVNRLLGSLFGAEAGWLLRGRLPWGMSLFCMARKPG